MNIVHFLRLLKPVFVCMSLRSCCTIYTPIPSYQQVKSSAMIDSTCTCKKYQGIVQRFPFVSVCYYDQKHQIEVIKRGIGWPLIFIIMRSIARIRFQFHVAFNTNFLFTFAQNVHACLLMPVCVRATNGFELDDRSTRAK